MYVYTRIDRNTHSCSLHVHWQGNIIVQLIWRLPLHMLVFVHNMYSTCIVYISYISRTNKHMALRPAVCLSLLRPTGGWLHTCSSHAKHICIFVFLYLCISVFEYFCVYFKAQQVAHVLLTRKIFGGRLPCIYCHSPTQLPILFPLKACIYCHSPPYTVSTEGLPVHLLQPPG